MKKAFIYPLLFAYRKVIKHRHTIEKELIRALRHVGVKKGIWRAGYLRKGGSFVFYCKDQLFQNINFKEKSMLDIAGNFRPNTGSRVIAC